MNTKICVIGLGYVGLPLAVSFSKKFPVIGFDLNELRIHELSQGFDKTNEASKEELFNTKIIFESDPQKLSDANFFIVAVPTPLGDGYLPDLSCLKSASETVGRVIKIGDTVVFESTVYPGVTEEVCIPIIEQVSGLKAAKDFWFGYSPERINPGDILHRFETITKVVSGCHTEALEEIANVYGTVVRAGVHKAPTIKTAEAAKVIENTQRDLNIALMNELAIIFERLNINTRSVLEAAKTKWNFLPFEPGLVGGHCIGVDPYYLTYKAQQSGYHPEVILAGRRINDQMGVWAAERLIKIMVQQETLIKGSRIGILGLTFKENCPDLRNSKVIDIINTLKEYGCNVFVCDPMAAANEAKQIYGIDLVESSSMEVDAVILAVKHAPFLEFKAEQIAVWLSGPKIVFDLKGAWSQTKFEAANLKYFAL